MKITTLLLLISISLNSSAQDIFSEDFAGEFPSAIQVVNDKLYVGTISSKKLYSLDLDNPSDIQLVTEFIDPSWKMEYNSLANDLYCHQWGTFSHVDLDQSPVLPMTILDLDSGNGLEINNNIIYLAVDQSIYTYDIAVGASSYELLYTDTEGDAIMNPRIYNNELYYQLYFVGTTPYGKIYKIDLANLGNQKVEVTGDLMGYLQSSLIVNNYLYLGLETQSRLLRLDLSDTNLPLTPAELLDNGGAGIIGLANRDSTIYYTSGFQILHTYQDPVLNVPDNVLSPLSTYPNPTAGLIYVKGDLSNDVTYTVYSTTGIKLKEGHYRDSINISDLSNGIYFITLNQNGNIDTMKIIKTDG